MGGDSGQQLADLLRCEEHRPRFGQYDHAADVVAVAVDRFAHLLLVAVDQLFLVSLQFGDAVGFAGVDVSSLKAFIASLAAVPVG